MSPYPSDPGERARQLVAEGRIGGPRYGRLGGRPRKPRAGEIAAEAAAEHAQEIVDVFRDALRPEQPIRLRLRAAEAWMRIEQKEASGQLVEDDRYSNMAKDEIIELLVAKLIFGPIGTLMRKEMGIEAASVSEPLPDDVPRGERGHLLRREI